MMSNALSIERCFRLRCKSRPARASSGREAVGKPARFPVRTAMAVTGAVVPTVTVTVCAAAPLNCTEELDKEHVGAGVAAGAIAHARLIGAENEPTGASDKLNIALCPAPTVWEAVDGPVMTKSGAACTTSARAT